ncbi:NAD(P)/FAD-dependent oxidoreductase [Mycobacterium sp.]|uniref:flavin-containing monooxygenase n=1 Tax=Mycobacterium sp. TaxID=1785 RepID=UPI0033421E24
MSEQHAVVIGAGPSGIAMAISLQDRGVRPLLVDRACEVASSWRTRYDRMKLNTGRQFSHLPGRPYPKGTATFPTRDQVVEHLDRHAREAGITLRLNTTVNRIEQRPGGWRLHTSDCDIDARHVVVATGMMHTPSIPAWPGEFTGEVLHSSEYHNPVPYAGRRVLVVGSGSSGMEIAHDLATGGAAKVWMAVRTPPNIMLRGGPAGLPGDVISLPLYHAPRGLADAIARRARAQFIGDLTEFGLPVPAEGPFSLLARIGHVPSLVDPDVIDVIRDGSIEVVATVDAFDDDGIRLVDGRRLDPDVVVCATGYLRGLEPLVGHLGVLDDRGAPRISGETPAAPGLWFLGFLARPSLIGFVGKQSRRLAKMIAKG